MSQDPNQTNKTNTNPQYVISSVNSDTPNSQFHISKATKVIVSVVVLLMLGYIFTFIFPVINGETGSSIMSEFYGLVGLIIRLLIFLSPILLISFIIKKIIEKTSLSNEIRKDEQITKNTVPYSLIIGAVTTIIGFIGMYLIYQTATGPGASENSNSDAGFFAIYLIPLIMIGFLMMFFGFIKYAMEKRWHSQKKISSLSFGIIALMIIVLGFMSILAIRFFFL